MYRIWQRHLVLGALAGVLIAWGCDTATTPASEALAPEEGAPEELRLRLPLLSSTVALIRTTSQLTDDVVSGLISEAGGLIELDGHSVSVPAGAVDQPTLFVMTVLAGDKIEVYLKAYDAATGEDVGGKGFLTPVTLALSYAAADVSDPAKVTIVRYLEDGSKQELPTTVDTDRQVAKAALDHFSRYGLCSN